MTLTKSAPALKHFLAKYPSLEGFVKALMDKPRQVSVHASGIVISKDKPLIDCIPLRMKDGEIISQWDMKDIEEAGFLKVDILGLTALTVIAKVLAKIEMDFNELLRVPLDDTEVYKMIGLGHTCGLFQIQTSGSSMVSRQVMPRTFSELVNLVALVRPVSKSEVEPYCYNREHGWEPIHPLLADILKGTNGILTFQEQAMQIAVALADFSVAEADELRRIIGKKIKDDVVLGKMYDRFMEVATKKTSLKIAKTVWKWLEGGKDYAFCKAHATAYAMTTYYMAWLKCYHYKEFMASHMEQEVSGADWVDKAVASYNELRNEEVSLIRPDIRLSKAVEFVITDHQIVMPYVAIKGVGDVAANKIEAAVKEADISTIDGIKALLKKKKLTPKPVELLIMCGALDYLGKREMLMKELLRKEVTWGKEQYIALEAKTLGFAL
jgi:DNA polymerase-3 subunit alpha